MEANVIKCPNCGASSSNHTNCEYCGSLLVRFVDKGIDLSTTSYMTNDKVYVGLIEALKQNLDRQELSDSAVETGIFYKSSPTVKLSRKRHGVATVFRSGSTTWSDGDPIKLGDKNRGLVIKFSFDKHAEENDISDERTEKRHQKFKSLGSFPLFTSHSGIYMRSGSSSRFRSQEYAIDFGQDVEGAARLISEVLSIVYNIPTDAQLIYLRENENIKEETKMDEKDSSGEDVSETMFTKAQKIGLWISIIWLVFALLGCLTNGYMLAVVATVCLMAAVICLFVEKLDKKFLWWVVAASFFIPVILSPSNSNEDSKGDNTLQNEQIEKESQNNESEKVKENNREIEQKKKDAELKAKQEESKKNKIAGDAYASGVHDAGELEYLENVKALIQAGYSKSRIEEMQKQQGRLNYKEEYGNPKNSEEESLMSLYGEKYAEGFMKTVFKD